MKHLQTVNISSLGKLVEETLFNYFWETKKVKGKVVPVLN
jgi:hypothetical protein